MDHQQGASPGCLAPRWLRIEGLSSATSSVGRVPRGREIRFNRVIYIQGIIIDFYSCRERLPRVPTCPCIASGHGGRVRAAGAHAKAAPSSQSILVAMAPHGVQQRRADLRGGFGTAGERRMHRLWGPMGTAWRHAAA